MTANDYAAGDEATLGGRHPLAARAESLDALTDGERDWIRASVEGTDRGDDPNRLVDDAARVADASAALVEARSCAAAFEGVDGLDVPTAAHLGALGVHDVDDLVAADSRRLAAELDVGLSQVRTWQYRARTRQ
ncbi:hypothetical protein G9C85_13555 [Halorubellus sp. JP-L1]|uniref:hypothetical protein n=1 Tax=Halorubellus sp. JP-L1 TaxID=2715753 RepID=UPI00140D609E|nr:hypothetical protein [Halorubellus sp. JP-L1]NHN42648.1 hypothetical protein [Halorubellus sp. JP-L1]